MWCYGNYLAIVISVLLLSTAAFLLDDQLTTCYKCGEGGDEHFPFCLESPITCDQGDVCRINHGYKTNKHGPQIRCTGRSSCSHGINDHVIPCPAGGVEVDHDECRACCDDSHCVVNITSFLHLEMMASHNLFCPGQCDVNNLKHCIDTGRVCDSTDFCQVKIDHARQVTGHCTDDHNWNHCLRDKAQTPCPTGGNITNTQAYPRDGSHHCTHDCCATNECLFEHFGIHMASSVANRPGGYTSNVTHQGGSLSLWSQIHGYCADTFDAAMCQHLKNNHGICTNRLNITMCLDTCGVCDSLHSNACVDVKGECQTTILAHQNYCQTPEAVFECAKSCNLCSKLIDSVITSVLGGVTAFPPAVTQPPSLVNCDDLNDYTCEYLNPLCTETFLGVVCPGKCGTCITPTSQLDISIG